MFPVDLFSLNEVADVQPFSVTLERESKNAMVIFKMPFCFQHTSGLDLLVFSFFTFLHTAWILSY
jgi:hypothetical protein